nr:hypothetical protein [Butyrivibrio sp.]
ELTDEESEPEEDEGSDEGRGFEVVEPDVRKNSLKELFADNNEAEEETVVSLEPHEWKPYDSEEEEIEEEDSEEEIKVASEEDKAIDVSEETPMAEEKPEPKKPSAPRFVPEGMVLPVGDEDEEDLVPRINLRRQEMEDIGIISLNRGDQEIEEETKSEPEKPKKDDFDIDIKDGDDFDI